MISFPPAKINLGLHILRKRPDGFHDLETVFYPLKSRDALEIIRKVDIVNEFRFTGIPVDCELPKNLVYKAWKILADDFPLPKLYVHLHKVLPSGAGLGGGSSDAAYTLKLINEVCDLSLNNDQLKSYASKLGSDCAFFIDSVPAIATGKGEILKPSDIDLSAYKIYVIMPELKVSTAEAYSWISPDDTKTSIHELIKLPVDQWQYKLHNDFEDPVFSHYPELARIKEQLYRKGAIYASLSGSGAALFGIFSSEVELEFEGCTILLG